MSTRIKYYGFNFIALPIVLYITWVFLGDIENEMNSFFAIFLSCSMGFGLGVAYAETLATKISTYYWFVTATIGLILLICFYLLELDKLAYIDPFSTAFAFITVTFGFKDEVLAKLTS